MKRERTIGTTMDAVRREEELLGRQLPPSYVTWLLANNGLYGVADISIFCVKDDRDLRKTWDSVSRQFSMWCDYCSDVFGWDTNNTGRLLPFASIGNGDYYCFDCGTVPDSGEPAVFHWSHETSETKFRARNFMEFLQQAESGAYDAD